MGQGLRAAAAIAAVSCATASNAADLPSRKEPPLPPPVYTAPEPVAAWSGFYVGLNAGGTFGGNRGVNSNAGDLFDAPGTAQGAAFAASASGFTPLDNGGFVGGGQVGYNYQFNRSFVVGLEADIQGLAGSSSTTSVGAGFDPLSGASPVTSTRLSKGLDYLGTVRGRLGFLATPTLLIYATGGLAYGGANLSADTFSFDSAGIAPSGFGSSSYSDTLVGWTVGAGLEWMFRPQWSAKVEYLYYDLGSVATPWIVVQGGPAGAPQWAYASSNRTRYDAHLVRAGVNYHFNLGAPSTVLARY